jgi:hypothetical protein
LIDYNFEYIDSISSAATAMPAVSEESDKAAGANEIVHRYMFGSFATQFLPSLPLLDHALQSRVQLQMVGALARHYGREFDGKYIQSLLRELVGISPEERAVKLFKDVLTQAGDAKEITQDAKAFLGQFVSEGAQKVAGQMMKTIIPGARLVLGYGEIVEPLATLYAVGRIFISHFESGGTIFTIKASAVKERYEKEFHVGQMIVELRAMQGNP